MRLTLLLLSLILTQPAAAQTRLTPDEFLDRAIGRTLTFSVFPTGEWVGTEQFLTRDRSVWAKHDGRCTYGDITRDGLYVCFRYEDEPNELHCWVPFIHDAQLLVRGSLGEIQQVTEITEKPVICSGAPMS
ncbi:MAG: hypothetical protein LJE68_10630 [Rhodobacter sp.]|jgi:hypothetical protein|nr:hypothetical protein [Rhodobacter sp.]